MTIESKLDLVAGDSLPDFTFGPVTRTMLALYAGASGDHNPAHIDIDFAKNAGLPDVFAQGMLSYGGLAQVITKWCHIHRLRSIKARFASIVQVHDLIKCAAHVAERYEEDDETRLKLHLTATTQDGRDVLVGEAIVAIS